MIAPLIEVIFKGNADAFQDLFNDVVESGKLVRTGLQRPCLTFPQDFLAKMTFLQQDHIDPTAEPLRHLCDELVDGHFRGLCRQRQIDVGVFCKTPGADQ